VWASSDTSAVVVLQVSDANTFYEIAGIVGFDPVPGVLQCAGVVAGSLAPLRVQKFSRSGTPLDTMYVGEADLPLTAGRGHYAIAMGRGQNAAARALAVLAGLRLLEAPASGPD